MTDQGYRVICGNRSYECENCIVSVGRSGSKWMEKICGRWRSHKIQPGGHRRAGGTAGGHLFHLTDELYESKIVYRTEKFEDNVRTFCMNPYGIVVNENTNGIVTVNGHSYEDPEKRTENTNFALLVSKHFSEPFKDSNGYGRASRGSPTCWAAACCCSGSAICQGPQKHDQTDRGGNGNAHTAGHPGGSVSGAAKRILDGIIEMIYALDKIAPGTANDDTLLYGVEVKFYNMEVELSKDLETKYPGLYIIGDGSGVTHSLSTPPPAASMWRGKSHRKRESDGITAES